MSEQRGYWYLLTGAVLGIALGLLTAWVFFPVPYSAASPASLRADFKDEYRYMIAAAYAVDGNLGRARARLTLLADKDPVHALGDQYQRMTAGNTAPDVVRSVADLAQALQADNTAPLATPPETPSPQATPQAMATPLPRLPSPTLTAENTRPEVSSTASITLQADTETPVAGYTATTGVTPTPTTTTTPLPTSAFTLAPRSTHTPTFTPGPPFIIAKQAKFCKPDQAGLLQISLTDSRGQPVAGVELVITWAGGEEHFFSGLKPELGNGYADFVMSPNVEYALSLSNGSTRVTGLSAPACTTADGANSYSGVRLDFKQP